MDLRNAAIRVTFRPALTQCEQETRMKQQHTGGMGLSRRSLLGAMLAGAPVRRAKAGERDWRYKDKVAIAAEDIDWFRQCRSTWIDCESGAPAIVPGELSEGAYGVEFDKDASPLLARLERLVCAYFLHAAFDAGGYALRIPLEGRAAIDVTPEHISLLRATNWRGPAIDCKRPYGDYTHFEIDMARALELPVTRSAKGYDEVADVVEQRMDALHKEMQFVLQAYIENARLAPGQWFIPYEGWNGIILPRCKPVGAEQIAAYESAMAVIALRALVQSPGDLVVPKIEASVALFAVN